MSEERFDRIDRKLTELDTKLESGLGAVNRRVDDLDRHMHVLHEDVVARIAAIPDNAAHLEARMDRGFADLRETFGRRLDPLGAC